MTTIPYGWKATTLGELGRYINGRGFKKSEWSDTGRPIIRIQNLTGSNSRFNRFLGDVEERYVVRPGDLLVSWAATLGAYLWTGEEGVLNQHIFKVESTIDRRFHRYLLDHKLAELMRQTHGSGMVHITRGSFDSLPVSIPDLSEQRRIVDILEDHLSRLDAGRAGLANEARLDALVAAAATTALRAAGGRSLTIGAIALSVKNGIFVSRAFRNSDGVPILRIGAVRPMSLDPAAIGYTGMSESEVSEAGGNLVEGDVLVTRYNGNPKFVASAAVVPGDVGPLAYPDKLMRVRLDRSVVLPDFLAIGASFGPTRRDLQARVKTTSGQAGISGRDLKATTLAVPDLSLQRAVVGTVQNALEASRAMKRASIAAMAREDQLRQALLAAAFAGRLTGRSPDLDLAEELASV